MSFSARTARMLVLLICSMFSVTAPAQTQFEPRLLSFFDFEDPLNGNLEDDPIGWRKLEGPGLPHYLGGKFDRDVKASGTFSYRLDLDGGSLIYRYPPGQIAVRQGGLYRVGAVVRTTRLQHARPTITAWLADEDGQPIDGTRVRQSLDSGTNLNWKTLVLEISNNSKNARSLVVEFGLLQPAQFNLDRPHASDLLVEDIRGSAWFDNLSIMEVPDIRLGTPNSGNFFDADEPMLVKIGLRDRIASDLSISAIVRDVDGQTVFQKSGGWTWQTDGSPNQSSTMIELPISEPGWYEVDFTLMSGSRVVSEISTNLVRLAESSRSGSLDRRFGFVATEFPLATWQHLPEILTSLAAGRVKLSVWDKETAIESPGDSPVFDRVLDAFDRRGIRIVGCLRALPPSIAQSLGGSEFERALNAKSSWKNQLAYLISRHAAHITSWQLLDDSSAERVAREPKLRLLHNEMHREVASLLEVPDLALPWPSWAELDGVAGKSIALSVPASILPQQIPLYVQSIRQSNPDRQIAVDLKPLDAAQYGLTEQRHDLAKRIVYALAANVERIELPMPLVEKQSNSDLTLDPTPLAPVIRTLFNHLSDTHFAGKINVAPGVEALLFERDRHSGVLILWSRGEQKRVTMPIGASPVQVDLNGKSRGLAKSKGAETELDVSAEPIVLLNVDSQLLRFQASVSLDQAYIESSFNSHQRRLQFVNTFDQAITGTINIRGPAGWTCSTSGGQFNLNPGERFDAPLTIDLPSNAITGEHTLMAELKISGRDDARFAIPINVQLRLEEVGLQTVAQRVGREIIVQQVITNYGNTPVDYTAYVLCPGVARQERLVSGLAPGMSMLKKYRFAAPKSSSPKLRSGLRQLDGPKMINEDVTVN